jgi:hypothetical protein
MPQAASEVTKRTGAQRQSGGKLKHTNDTKWQLQSSCHSRRVLELLLYLI